MVKYKVIVDREQCISCGAAPAVCSQVFELGSDNGKNRVVDKFSIETSDKLSIGIVPEELHECVKSGAEVCPVSAIRIERIED
ncbi:MAG: ferredoxin [Desulfurococcaceae archaeon]|uniref:Ferredoxin n=1 Tax=Staphylothermus marinus TaxID=2280 RepID=A0A7C4NNU3_STAMA